MRVYSVSEAVGPAWERTKLVLRTGRWGSNFKMAFVVLLAEMGALMVLPLHSFVRLGGRHVEGPMADFARVIAVYSVLLGVVFTVGYAALFYFGSRMQLTLVDLVLLRSHTVAPLWARHRQSVWRWMGLKLVPSILFVCGLLPFSVALAQLQRFSAPPPGVDPQVAAQIQIEAMKHAFAGVFATSAVYFLLFAAAMWLYSHWRDFVMPYLGIDQMTVGDALNRWAALWREYPGQMTGYVFFRILLLIGVLLVFYIALFVALAIPIALAVLFGVLLKMLVHGTTGAVLMVVFVTVALLVLFAWYLLATLFGLAVYATFFQCYSLYFLGGRDQRIGQLLEPEAAVPLWTPPPSMPRDDNSSGPDFPADPALA